MFGAYTIGGGQYVMFSKLQNQYLSSLVKYTNQNSVALKDLWLPFPVWPVWQNRRPGFGRGHMMTTIWSDR